MADSTGAPRGAGEANHPCVLAYLREPGHGVIELCILPRVGPLQVFQISNQTTGRLCRESAEIVTRHRR